MTALKEPSIDKVRSAIQEARDEVDGLEAAAERAARAIREIEGPIDGLELPVAFVTAINNAVNDAAGYIESEGASAGGSFEFAYAKERVYQLRDLFEALVVGAEANCSGA
jgi:hypothetical protein